MLPGSAVTGFLAGTTEAPTVEMDERDLTEGTRSWQPGDLEALYSAMLGALRDQRCAPSSSTMKRATSVRVIRQPPGGVLLSVTR